MNATPPPLVVLSAHLDDAVLSVGGWIRSRAAAGQAVCVRTVFAAGGPPRTPLARRLHDAWGLGEDAARRRRDEDVRALARLHPALAHVHDEHPDAIHRCLPGGPACYPDWPQLFGAPHPLDRPDADELAGRIARDLGPDALVACPLGFGGHVDHRLLRAVGDRLAAAGRRVWFYEDWPYRPARPDLDPLVRGLRARTVPIGRHLVARLHAGLAYRSQHRTLARGPLRLALRLLAAALRTGRGIPAERVWTAPPLPA